MNVALLEKKMSELRLRPVDVASRSGICEATILRILNGESKKPRLLTLRALAALLGVPEEDLYTAPPRSKKRVG